MILAIGNLKSLNLNKNKYFFLTRPLLCALLHSSVEFFNIKAYEKSDNYDNYVFKNIVIRYSIGLHIARSSLISR